MKYVLSIEFEDQGEFTNYAVGDVITFVSMRGLLKNGLVKEIKYLAGTNVPTEYKVDCNGKDFIAVSDYVLKKDAHVWNVRANITETDQWFPLRT